MYYYLICSARSFEGNVNDYGHSNNPLAHLSESVNSIDPLNAMEKSLNEVNITNFSSTHNTKVYVHTLSVLL